MILHMHICFKVCQTIFSTLRTCFGVIFPCQLNIAIILKHCESTLSKSCYKFPIHKTNRIIVLKWCHPWMTTITLQNPSTKTIQLSTSKPYALNLNSNFEACLMCKKVLVTLTLTWKVQNMHRTNHHQKFIVFLCIE